MEGNGYLVGFLIKSSRFDCMEMSDKSAPNDIASFRPFRFTVPFPNSECEFHYPRHQSIGPVLSLHQVFPPKIPAAGMVVMKYLPGPPRPPRDHIARSAPVKDQLAVRRWSSGHLWFLALG